MSIKQHNKRPFFIDGYQCGDLVLNIPLSDDYGLGCELGKAGVYDYIRAGYEADSGLFIGGLLQSIVLSFADREEPLTTTERGFIVGFFSQLEKVLGSHFFNEHTAAHIKKHRLNDAVHSPLVFRDREAVTAYKGGEA